LNETGILECYYNRPAKQPGGDTLENVHATEAVGQLKSAVKEQMDRIVDVLIACKMKMVTLRLVTCKLLDSLGRLVS
jgi:hypothetical protein